MKQENLNILTINGGSSSIKFAIYGMAENANKIVFYSKGDMAGPDQLEKGESILRNPTKSNYTNINDILENLPFAKSKEAFIKEELGEETYRLMEQIKRVQTQKGVQAMMPFEITIQ